MRSIQVLEGPPAGILALVFTLALAAGCAQDRAGAAGAPSSGADSVATRARAGAAATAPSGGAARAVMRAFAFTQQDTIRLSPEAPPPEPTATYPSLEAVRDTVEAMARRGVALGDTAVHVSLQAVTFQYQWVDASASGWAIHAVVTDTSACPVDYVEHALEAAGWAPRYDYGADGPDGTAMGYVTKEYFCKIEGRWDGGDDSDTTYVPAPGCEMMVTCVKRRLDDVAPKY